MLTMETTTYVPQVSLVRADIARLRGDYAGVRRELSEAHRRFTEIGADGHARAVAQASARRRKRVSQLFA